MDRFLECALRQAVYVLKPLWLPAFTAGKLTFDDQQKRLEFVIKADGSADTIQALHSLLNSPALSRETREIFLRILVETGGTDDLALVLDAKTFTTGNGYDAVMHAHL